MSTIKSLAFELQRHLQSSVSSGLPRSHVHELLAACGGFASWAAMNSQGLLANGEAIGEALPAKVGEISGRCSARQSSKHPSRGRSGTRK
jgi:hypothetical protein